MYVFNRAQGSELERYLCQNQTVCGMWMGAAGAALYQRVRECAKRYGHRVLVLCGPGNNGGDGLALACLLAKDEVLDSYIICEVNDAEMSQETLIYANRLRAMGIKRHTFAETKWENFDIIVDCLFGSGCDRVIKAPYDQWIAAVNATDAYVIACDLPSGIDTDSGHVLGCAIKAQETLSIFGGKPGLYFNEGLTYSGRIQIARLGVDEGELARFACMEVLNDAWVKEHLPKRRRNSHKGDYGRILVIGGRCGMSGAALLCSEAALRCGAGMVTLMSEARTLSAAAIRIPEAMQIELKESLSLQALKQLISDYDWIAIGNGLGRDDFAKKLVRVVWQSERLALFDGDALALLREVGQESTRTTPYVLTPHPKELSYLLGINTQEILENPLESLYRGEKAYPGSIIVCKNACTMISDGIQRYLNVIGSDALAKGGSGDVLCGMILAFLAQGKAWTQLAGAAVYLHARCACTLSKKWASHSILPQDCLKQIPKELHELLEEKNEDE